MKWRNMMLGAVLCFAGGAIDGYSYVMRGGVLATAQTANLLLLGIQATNGNWGRVVGYLLPILCFMSGTYLAKLAYETIFQKNSIRWQEGVVVAEALIFVGLGCLDERVPDILVNAMISFFSSMQYCAFRSLGAGAPYSTVFSTGNMRSMVDNIYEGTIHRDPESRIRMVAYAMMLVAFACGAGGSNLLSKKVGYHACWLVSVVLSIAFLMMSMARKSETDV